MKFIFEEENRKKVFGGANTSKGYVGDFDSLLSQCRFIRIIKGTPGSGKSTMMKKIRDRALFFGESVTEILCTADENSLDGIILNERSTAIIDGTSPHCAEVKLPFIKEKTVNCEDCVRKGFSKLDIKSAQCAKKLFDKKKNYYNSFYAFLSCAQKLADEGKRALCSFADISKLKRFVHRLADKIEREEKSKVGQVNFRDAIFPHSDVHIGKSGNEILVSDMYFSGRVFLDLLLEEIKDRKINANISPSYLNTDSPNSIYFENSKLEYILSDGKENKSDEILNPRRFFIIGKSDRAYLRELKKQYEKALSFAKVNFAAATNYHGKIEDIYKEITDFSAVDEKCEALKKEIFEN